MTIKPMTGGHLAFQKGIKMPEDVIFKKNRMKGPEQALNVVEPSAVADGNVCTALCSSHSHM